MDKIQKAKKCKKRQNGKVQTVAAVEITIHRARIHVFDTF